MGAGSDNGRSDSRPLLNAVYPPTVEMGLAKLLTHSVSEDDNRRRNLPSQARTAIEMELEENFGQTAVYRGNSPLSSFRKQGENPCLPAKFEFLVVPKSL